MNPNTPQPSFELPAPQPIDGNESNTSKNEQAASRPEQAPQPIAAQPSAPQSSAPIQNSPMQAINTTAPNPQASNGPVIADDNDLIEKEWVVKAKQIVSATKNDPHTQNREISRFKADYLKKRYNKDIKLEDA